MVPDDAGSQQSTANSIPDDTTRLLALEFNDADDITAVTQPSTLAVVKIGSSVAVGSDFVDADGVGSGGGGGYATGFAVDHYPSVDGSYLLIGDGPVANGEQAWAADSLDGHGDRTFIVSYQGSDAGQRATTGPSSYDCAITLFGNPDAGTIYLSLGLEDGKIAVCGNPDMSTRDDTLGSTDVTDGEWHQLAWTYSESANELKAYVDGTLELTVPSAKMSNCVSSQCVIVSVGGGSYYNWGATMSEHVATRVDNVYVFADVLTAAQLNAIAVPIPAPSPAVNDLGTSFVITVGAGGTGSTGPSKFCRTLDCNGSAALHINFLILIVAQRSAIP